jgi:hypothetical protein
MPMTKPRISHVDPATIRDADKPAELGVGDHGKAAPSQAAE